MSAARAGSVISASVHSASAACAALATRGRFKRTSLVVDVADEEVSHRARTVVAVESVSVVEPDVAEQRDLEPEAYTGPHLEIEWAVFLPQVPSVSSIEEK